MHYRLYSITDLKALQCVHCKYLEKRRLPRVPRHSRTFRCQVVLPSHIAESLDLFRIQCLAYINLLFSPTLLFGGIGSASLCVLTPHIAGVTPRAHPQVDGRIYAPP